MNIIKLYANEVETETALMFKGVFSLSLFALQGFKDSIFTLMDISLNSPDYTSISKRSKTVQVLNIRTNPKALFDT